MHRGPVLTRRLRAVVALGAAAAGVLLLSLGVLLGLHWGPGAGSAPAPAAGSVDAGFALDMQAHHRQAVEMSTLVLDRTDDDLVRQLALDIQLTQQQQAGQMHGWLEQWGLGQGRTEPVMAWMAGEEVDAPPAGHGTAGHGASGHAMSVPADGLGSVGAMPGMATSEQLAALEAADGAEAERIYLQLMIPHHVAGVEMARVAADEAADAQVRQLATAMATGQQAELTVLRDLLAERGGPVAGV